MGEMDTQNRDDDAINAELFGNDVRVDYAVVSFNVSNFKANLENMIKNAKNNEDLNAIGSKLDEAIDNKYNMNVLDYQFQASKKMREIYNVVGEPVKGERIKIKKSELN